MAGAAKAVATSAQKLLSSATAPLRKAGGFAGTHVEAAYKSLLENNKQYIVKDPSPEKCAELSKQLLYTRLASIPGRYQTMRKEVKQVKKIWDDLDNVSTRTVGTGLLFAAECYALFVVGEIVGRRGSLTGYNVE
eukprot:jgi/Chlat1/3645/Chrsp238S03639